MDLDDLVKLLTEADRADVISGLLGLTASERKELRPHVRGWLTRGTTTGISDPCTALALFATADSVRQAMLAITHFFGYADYVEDVVTILEERDPGWLPDFVDALLKYENIWVWRLVRGLVRAGAVPAPGHPEYFRGTVRALPIYYSSGDRTPLARVLERDPDLIGEHLIGMISTEGSGRLLADHDKYCDSPPKWLDRDPFPDGTWRQAIVTLVEEGRLDRSRILDAVLSAPLRDWAAADTGWYVGMHDALEPSTDEVTARQPTYARLLAAEHGPSVKAAQREFRRLLGDPRFDPTLVLDASRATLSRTDKATVAAQLRLLERLAKAHPTIPIADTVRIAADHPRVDVREQVATLLGRLGESEPIVEQAGPFVVPAPEPRSAPHRVEPVASADELGEVMLTLIEHIDAIEMERAIDGLLRFADVRPRTADLLWTRANQGEYYSLDPRIAAAAALARVWLAPRGRRPEEERSIVLSHRDRGDDTLVGALERRLSGVAQAIRRGSRAAVALPIHADGSLDADVLSERLSAVRPGHEPPELEVAIALLRVVPEDRASVVLPSSLREWPAIARALALRPVDWARETVLDTGFVPRRRIPIFRDRGGRAGGDALDGVLPGPRPEQTAGDEATSAHHYRPSFEQTLALGAALLPHDPDVLAAQAHPYFYRDLHWARAVCVPVLDALARARSSNGDPESSALLLGMAAKDARARTAAQDALFDLARHGLLDGARLGRQGALLLQDEVVVGQRVSAGLSEVARASDAAVLPVLDALQQLMAILPGRRDAGPFVELAADLSRRTGRRLQLPAEFRSLAAGQSSSVLAKAARRLLR